MTEQTSEQGTEQISDRTPDASADADDPRVQVLQAVVDRVLSWQEGAEPDVVRRELDDAIAESDVEVDDETRDRIVSRIADAEPAHFDVREVLS